MKYKLTNKRGQVAEIEAARFERDGSGTRFFDADGDMIASFGDGEIRSVAPEGLTFDGDET